MLSTMPRTTMPPLRQHLITAPRFHRTTKIGQLSYSTKNSHNDSFFSRIRTAWTETPIKWYPLPIAVGALVLVSVQYRKNRRKVIVDENGMEVVKVRGPWQVHVMGALPLQAMSRLWGYMNSLELPIWFRPYGFRLYSYIFGCNLREIENEDLTAYASLGEFFYRRLKPDARPVDQGSILVSPADGRVLHFGQIQGDAHIEQVKGMTYSLDALLGIERPGSPTEIPINPSIEVVNEEEFANVNGIEYSLDQLIGNTPSEISNPLDVSSERSSIPHDASVALEIGSSSSFATSSRRNLRPGNTLFFAVIYLAPGDYHRFHSPTAWVVEKRRHFPGELFSVSPYIARRLENLFVLNERVALLGRWRYGFFGMVPVGATNVGSIVINFDTALRTNEKRKMGERKVPPGTYVEAVYRSASKLLGGQPLTTAEEMGGFKLGSTVVLVFEAPKNFQFSIQAEQRVRVGQKLGDVPNQIAFPRI